MHKNKRKPQPKSYWDMLIKEVTGGNYHLSPPPTAVQPGKVMYENRYERRSVRYTLGEPLGSVYFTQREAECIMQILAGKTMNQAGEALKLSARTIEYYLGRIKKKLHCRKKKDIIRIVSQTDFIKNFEKDPYNQTT